MTEKFIFDGNSNIIIYGAATTGSILVDRLKEADVCIRGFIDKRAYEIDSLKGYPVWDIMSKELAENIDANTVIVIAVKNVFQHQSILKQLIKHTSCRSYIYMPMVENDGKAQIMKNTFNDLMYESISFPYELEKVQEIKLNNFTRFDNRKTVDNKVVVLVPVGFVFTNNVEEKKSIWGDVPILAYFPHIRLFQFFENNVQGSIESYLQFCVLASQNMEILQSDSWKNNILENRKNVYDQMLNEYELSMDFFYDNAPTAKWNDKGYFNLTSGKHRATFLASKRCRYIPLRISLDDEKKWLNYNIAERTYNYLNEMDFSSFQYTIDNPYFYRYKNTYGDFWNVILANVVCNAAEYLYNVYEKVSFANLRVLNLFDDNRYLVRYLYKMGAKVIDLSKQYEIEAVIDKVFHCNYVPQKEETEKEYDLVITKYMGRNVELDRVIQFVVCEGYDEIYKNRATKIGTTIGSNGIVNMYYIKLN